MKLYAKTTSERASKGQGGKWLDIEIRNEQKRLLAMITIRATEPQSAVIGIMSAPDVRIDLPEQYKKSKSEPCKALTGRKEWCESKAVKDGYCKPHYEEMREFELSTRNKKCTDITCVNNDRTMEGICSDCKDKQKGKSQKGEKLCGIGGCKNPYNCNMH